MTQAKRRIAITRKVSLAPFADDWDDCYAIVTLADFQEKVELQKTDVESMTDFQATKFMLDVTEKHFVAGKIRVLNADNQPELVDMEKRDIASSVQIINTLYLTSMGVTLDPKATPTQTETSSTPPATSEPSADESSTKTTSSTESPAQ